jgi:hypothetical protein
MFLHVYNDHTFFRKMTNRDTSKKIWNLAFLVLICKKCKILRFHDLIAKMGITKIGNAKIGISILATHPDRIPILAIHPDRDPDFSDPDFSNRHTLLTW